MKKVLWRRAEELFHTALEHSPEARRAFLDKACGEDTELRHQVETLLSQDDQAGSFLETPAIADATVTPGIRGSLVGRQFGSYRILSSLGAGGMGEVYRARDGFQREAKLLASLNHPNIAAIYGLEESSGTNFLVLELVEGETLAEHIKLGPIPVEESLKLALQITEALEAAHEKGVIHRDLKPANIKVTPEGKVKVLDFGLAKAFDGEQADLNISNSSTLSMPLTQQGVILGTAAYMSPEQVEGKPLDARSDVFSMGAVLYELLTSQRAFHGDSAISTMSAILRDTPARASKLRPDMPYKLETILNRCLEKDRDLRYPKAVDVQNELKELQEELLGRSTDFRAILQPRIVLPVLLVLATTMGVAAWLGVRSYRVNRVRNEMLPEIARLTDQGEYGKAFELATRAAKVIPDDKILEGLWPRLSRTITIETDPPGAAVSMKSYEAVDAVWEAIGRTPITGFRIPQSYFRWRISKEGYEQLETGGPPYSGEMRFRLIASNSPQSGMVCLSDTVFRADLSGFEPLGPWPMEAFCIDRFEVTNRQYKQFVDAGGYRKREYWQHPFRADGRSLTWEEAMKRFVDSSGRPGPATWEAGTYRGGQDNLPVGGVSWYEAAAYAEYAGKSLPTLYHWYQASGIQNGYAMVPLSNFAGKGSKAVGASPGVSLHGVFDMAGNHREWVWTETDRQRYCLGGAWNDPAYFLMESEARSPFDRARENGFRCVKYQNCKAPPARYAGALKESFRDFSREKPASDEAFRIIESMYPRDTGPLDAKVESEQSQENRRVIRVSYAAGYGGERLPAYLILPKNAVPPYQTVIWFPGANALQMQKSDTLVSGQYLDFIVQSGRAMLYPIYKGTYERNMGLAIGHQSRESLTWWVSEVRRSVDYLESRPDIDGKRIAYAGSSWGARMASIMLAMETRLSAAVLYSGGYLMVQRSPEIDDFNYTPRVRAPVLMINGRYDFDFRLETSAEQMFKRLGTPADRKKLVVFDSGHNISVFRGKMIRETLDWLDCYLGPVKFK